MRQKVVYYPKIFLALIPILSFSLILSAHAQSTDLVGVTAISASSSVAGGAYPPASATDSNESTKWNSGGNAPAWIYIDLGRSVIPSRIRLLPSQYPAGNTTHIIEGINEFGVISQISSITGYTSEAVWIQIDNLNSSKYKFLRIKTQTSPSWVSWKEIQVTDGGELYSSCTIMTGGGLVAIAASTASAACGGGRVFTYRKIDRQPYGLEIYSCQGWNLPSGWSLISSAPANGTACSDFDISTAIANRFIYRIKNNNPTIPVASKPAATDVATGLGLPTSLPNTTLITWPTNLTAGGFNP